MKNLVILGAGTGGTIMANKMRKLLSKSEWNITIIDKEHTHYYQPGFIFIPFGRYTPKDVVKPIDQFIPKGVERIVDDVDRVDAENSKIILSEGKELTYDYLIIATGTRIAPEETTGMMDEMWHKDKFDFYTLEGSMALADYFKTWRGGELVLNIAEMPIKCPVAPLEFVMLADGYFKKWKMRDKVNITFVTPLSGAFTKKLTSEKMGELFKQKNINIVTDFNIMEVDNEKKHIIDYAGQEIKYDCLVSIPVHTGDKVIERSGLGDDLGFVPVDKHTLQSVRHENIFVIGDATNVPASKAGSVVHFEAEILEENLMAAIEGKSMLAKFDGHSNCFVETGIGKGTLIDFNYDIEPLPGKFPLPVVGPFKLLKENRLNHWGKLMFRWLYWKMLLPGKKIPTITTHFTMRGKIQIKKGKKITMNNTATENAKAVNQ